MTRRLQAFISTILNWFAWPFIVFWRYLGQLGLALRHLLAWPFYPFVWFYREIIAFVFRPIIEPLWPIFQKYIWRTIQKDLWGPFYKDFLLPIWKYIGFLGKALRQILAFIFSPITRPVAWLFTRLSQRWQATFPQRIRFQKRWRSWWEVKQARWRVFWQTLLRRRPLTKEMILIPKVVREKTASAQPTTRPRWVVVFATGNILFLALASFYLQFGPAAVNGASTPTAVSQATISPTPTPSLTPTPATIALTPWPTPDPLKGGGSVAFALQQNGRSDLYILSVGQSQPVRVTNHPAEERDPVWSADGRYLAFSAHRNQNWDIYVLDMLTGETTRVTNQPGYDGAPSWSPDGQWLVYESYQNNNLDIYISKQDGSEGPLRLTEAEALDFAPAWGPDGRHIAFVSRRNGLPDVYLMSLDTAGDQKAINLTNTPNYAENNPVFHPQAAALAYERYDDGLNLIYTFPLANYQPAGEPTSLGQGLQPTWSPGGDSLAYVHQVGEQHFLLATAISAWAVAPQTYSTPGRISHPTWSAITLAQEPTGFLLEVSRTIDPTLFTEVVSTTTTSGQPPFQLRELPNTAAPYPFLSDQVDQSFMALRQRVITAAGWDFLGELDQIYEPLNVRPEPGLNDRNWLKAGRAFHVDVDLALAFDPRVEIVPEPKGDVMFWRVYLRAEQQDGTQGEPLRHLPWDFRARFGADPRFYEQGGTWKERIPAGYYVDFTALAQDYGWSRVPALNNWRTYFPGVLFWQFENHQGLNWEQAMLELYTAEQILAAYTNR